MLGIAIAHLLRAGRGLLVFQIDICLTCSGSAEVFMKLPLCGLFQASARLSLLLYTQLGPIVVSLMCL